ncbi:MAG: hypothetical protein GY811_09225 [Myxococcales bacterium]|nr:hypothetical protein [Myxococcales bacterium]
MKLSTLLIVLAGLALCGLVACSKLNRAAPTSTSVVIRSVDVEAGASSHLRVATYNVHMETAEAISAAILGNIELAAADIVLLQEVEAHPGETMNRAEQVAERLGMSAAYAPGYGLPGGGSHGVAILSRVALRDVEVIELPYYHVVVNSARRVALAATVRLDGQDVRIYSVHLDNRINPSKRRRQLQPVFQAAQNFPGPVVIAGDLNTSPFCWAGNLIPIPCGKQDNAVEDAALAIGMDTPLAKSGSTSKWFSMRLDAVYTRGLITDARAVERSVRLSDHLPVWAEFRLPASHSRTGLL